MQDIILLLGPPGAGKGTQGILLSKALNIPHISMGDLLRSTLEDGREDAKIILDHMNKGSFAPAEVVNKIIAKTLASDKCKTGCILDGYPRNLEQAEYFINNVNANVTIIYLKLDQDAILQRILGRMTCALCKAIYNKYFDKPKKESVCDECGSKDFTTRDDDDHDVIMSRIALYKEETLPLMNYYEQHEKFFIVDANQSKENLITEIVSIVKNT